jgi:type II secretory pathway component PulJ
MKMPAKKTFAAFTLVEVLLSVACSSIVLAAVITAGVALQRSFAAVEGYSIAEGDQLRVQDYIGMDCRRAIGATVDNGSWTNSGGTWSWTSNASGPATLMLTLPGYYDASGNVQAPSFNASAAIQYGSGSNTTISYYMSGTSFMRQVGTNPTQCAVGAAWNNCSKAIATNVNSFTVTPSDLTTTVRCTVTFAPRFTNTNPGVAGTTVYANTFLRNAAARH